jgi:hypothetical protein
LSFRFFILFYFPLFCSLPLTSPMTNKYPCVSYRRIERFNIAMRVSLRCPADGSPLVHSFQF